MSLRHSGAPAQAEHDLARIRSLDQPIADIVDVKEYAAQQSMLDATQPKGLHYYWKSEFLPTIDSGLIDTYLAQFKDNDSPSNQIVLFHVGGDLNNRADDDGAVGNRDAAFACVIAGSWQEGDPAGEDYRQWVRRAWKAIQPYSTGGNYINFQTADEIGERTESSYGNNYRELRRIKAKYDPTNMFRVNRNIPPHSPVD